MRRSVLILLALVSIEISGCAASRGAYAPLGEVSRNSLKAQSLTQQAAALMDEDPAEAERLLREALAADPFHGPAHNSLGVIFLNQEKLYEAANEFEWACKLMPGHPDARMNLAVTLERAGRIGEAISTYETALEVCPDHLPTIQAVCRCQLRHRRIDDRTYGWLEEVALRGESEEWREWARVQMAKLRR